MSKQADKTLVGAFMIGGLTLLIVAIAVFGSGKLFQQTERLAIVFESSISGLNIGSPVVFRGVPVGRVSDILLKGNVQNMAFSTPVFIELDLQKTSGFVDEDDSDAEANLTYFKQLIEHGFRARLSTLSMLTGQLMIELDFFPEDETGSVPPKLRYVDGVPEIPSIPSRIDTVLQRLRTMPLDSIAHNILEITDSLNAILKQSSTQQVAGHLNELLVEVQSIAVGVHSALNQASPVVESYIKLAEVTTNRVDDTLGKASTMLVGLDSAVREAERTMLSIRGLTGQNSVSVVELNRALREMTEAARAIRSLANMIDRNPESLLRGKGASRP